MNGEEFNKIDSVDKKNETNLSNIYWIGSILEKNSKCIIINSNIYYQEKNNAPGRYSYSFAEVMIKNYFEILEEFIGKGLYKETIESEKDNLVARSLWYLEYGLKRKDALFTKNFEGIFYEFYKDKPYFKQAWEELLKATET